MRIKKQPQYNLEKYSKIFLQLGLVLALLIVHALLEHQNKETKANTLTPAIFSMEEVDQIVEVEIQQPPKPKPKPKPMPKPKPKPKPEKIKVVEKIEEVEETVVEEEEKEPEEETEETTENTVQQKPVSDLPLVAIEQVPVYPGCSGSREEKKKCFERAITKHVQRKFNTDLANELGLSSGKKRIFVKFVIDVDGRPTRIVSQAPHPRLQKEAERLINLLPTMTPGKQGGVAAPVTYSLPIAFVVE